MAHSATFTSLSLEHLAQQYPDKSFVQSYPGFAKTASLTNWIVNDRARCAVESTVVPLVSPFMVSVDEVGERQLSYLTSSWYGSANGEAQGVNLVEGLEAAKDEGAYMVKKYGEEGEGGS